MVFIAMSLAKSSFIHSNEVEIRDENGELIFGRPGKTGMHTRFAVNAQFIMWDGEACTDTGYCYFANSAGDELLQARQLTSLELIEMLLSGAEDHPNSIHFGYGFDYDVDNILMDVPRKILAILNRYNAARWRTGDKVYRFEYIPRKIFQIKECIRERIDKRTRESVLRTIKLYDVVSFFNCRYDKALIKYGIGDPDELDKLEAGKDARSFFLYKNIDQIVSYCKLELAMGPKLMDKLRAAVHGAGYRTSQWYGPGAISKLMIKQHKVKNAMNSTLPDAAASAAIASYAGGWIERFGIGYHEGDIWIPDINSAYPYALSLMPNLATGQWHHIDNPDPMLTGKYRLGFYRIRYDVPRDQWQWSGKAYPLFRRQANGMILHPPRVENWYHAPEAATVASDPHAQFMEAWVYEDDGTYPLAWIADDYAKRQELVAAADPSEMGIKLGLNAMYGTFAQQCGWDRKAKTPPKWHQIEWAGFATSKCRAMIYDAVPTPGKLISIDTDGMIMTEEPEVDGGNALGQWKVKHYSAVAILQNGLYWLRNDNGEWEKPKTRGINRRRIPLDIGTAMSVLRGDTAIDLTKHQYVGFKSGFQLGWEKRGTWVDRPMTINIHTSGGRRHYTLSPELECQMCRDGISLTESIHPCRIFFDPRSDFQSKPHSLEWLEGDEKEMRFKQWLVSLD